MVLLQKIVTITTIAFFDGFVMKTVMTTMSLPSSMMVVL
jgi:hypothetical protein